MKLIIVYIACLLMALPYTSKVIYYAYWNINRAHITINLCENKDDKTLNCFGQCQLDKVIKSESPKENLPLMPAHQYQFSVYTPISFPVFGELNYTEKIQKTIIPYIKSVFLSQMISLPSPPPELG